MADTEQLCVMLEVWFLLYERLEVTDMGLTVY